LRSPSRKPRRNPRIKLEAHVRVPRAVSAIVAFVKSGDVLVVGFMGQAAVFNRLSGGMIGRLVEHAPCDVPVVK